MSHIERLIAERCPQGVEHKPLGDLGDFIRGQGLQKKDLLDSGVPAIHYGQIHTHYGVWTAESKSFTSKESASKLRHARHGDLLIATTSEDDDAVGKATAWLGAANVVLSGDAYIYRHSLDPKYVAYFFQSTAFQQQKQRYISGAKVRRLSGDSMSKILVPVPPLEVQREIVRVLDQLSQLEAELEAELEARRRQYSHYAASLLAVDERTAMARLGELSTIVRGASPRPIRRFLTGSGDGLPWIKIGDVPADGKYITGTNQHVTAEGASKSRRIKPGDFVLSNSMSFGRPYISKIEGFIHDGWLAISDFNDSFSADYLYYLLRSAPVQQQFASQAGASTVKNLNAEIVRNVEVPIPPREKQDEVVDLLDRFDALANDLSIGLPAELVARRKQYEYYRDKLLTFEEAPA